MEEEEEAAASTAAVKEDEEAAAGVGKLPDLNLSLSAVVNQSAVLSSRWRNMDLDASGLDSSSTPFW